MTNVTIYALINPLTGDPFYVGSTQIRLDYRLDMHIRDIRTDSGKHGTKQYADKSKLMQQIIDEGEVPELLPLLKCSRKAARKCEKHIYNLLLSHGFTLLQCAYHLK